MSDGRDWLYRPALAEPPLIKFESLFDGSIGLYEVALANEALDVREHNREVMMKANKDG